MPLPALPCRFVDCRLTFALLVASAVLALSADESSAAVFAEFDPVRHERFLTGQTPNPSFILGEDRISGVALARATLITPRHYLTARHSSISMPSFRGSDGVVRDYSTSHSTILTTTLPGGGTADSDLLLYTLDAPIPDAHGVQPLALIDASREALLGREFVLYGQDGQAGRNTIDDALLVTFEGGGSPTYNIQYSFDTAANGGSGGIPQDEAGLIVGDSGHPALIQVGSDLALIGTHFGIDIDDMEDPADLILYDSFSTWVTPYLDQIRDLTQAEGFDVNTITITAVPEPSTTSVLTLLAVIGLRASSRRPSRRTCCQTPPQGKQH